MSTLFNYGSPGKTGGWSDKTKYFEEKEIDGDDFKSTVRARENPRVAIPSPFARFKIVQDAFETVSDAGTNAEERDQMLVSQVLDILELLYENGVEKNRDSYLSIRPVKIKDITDDLTDDSVEDRSNGTYLFGRTIRDYAEREQFGFSENPMLFAICSVDKPLAITSPTSVVLPTPNYNDAEWSNVLINGVLPIFSERRNLISRNEEFVLYLYAWHSNLIKNNGGEPKALKSFGTYLNTQKEAASKELKIKIQSIQSSGSELSKAYSPILTTNDRLKVEIWHTPLYSLSEDMEGSMIEEQSDLILRTTVGNVRPLILTSNNVYSDMVYTNGNTMWDRKNRGFDYDDFILKSTPINQRTTLPNGQFYPDGFIYEHDFLADTLIQLPYQLNSDKYFDGNIEGLKSEKIGLIPPIKEEYFDYFTADDLRENLHMAVTHNTSEQVDKVEVTLKLPTTSGREIVLKKTYFFVESLKTSIQEVISAPDKATGLIGQCGVAVNALPFNRAFADNNYYAFQLYVDTYGLDGYCINLKACRYIPMDGDEGHEIKKTFSRYIRRKENGVPVITSYSLDGENFDYLKLTFTGKKDEDRHLSALLIPRVDIQRYERNPGKKLEFCFDFGTSNTFVAVKDMESGLYIDFKLPTETDMVVSTMADDPTNADDITVKSFMAYCKQAFLPKVKDRLPFPISTVLSAPKNPDDSASFAPAKDPDETLTNPFFAGSIPFLYGSEDYDSQTNRIIANLKWAYRKKGNKEKHFTASFINELLFLAQVFAMSKNADLNQCSIYWTYPLSMDKKMIESLQTLWIKGYQKYFEGLTEDSDESETHKNVNSFPESMAPMLFYTSDEKYKIKSSDTTISVDIGGGTCDLVIIPSKLSKLKLTSFGFGAECIFGINAAAESIAMFKNAIKSISKAIKGRAVDSNPNKREFENKVKELEGMMAEGRRANEMSTYLFNLSNNPLFAGMGKQVDFNQWIQDHPLYHTVFLYYYAALIYYIAELWKTFKTAAKPSRILFSGSGSKMFNILSGGNNSILSDYTTQLFNIFAKDELEEEDLEEDVKVKMEVKEPKQITAKGVLTSSEKMEDIKKDMQKWRSASVDGKEYIFNFDMVSKSGKSLTYGDLENDDLIETLCERFGEFHEGLMKFLKDNEEDFDEDSVSDMERMFTEKYKTPKKWCRAIAAALGDVVENTTENRDDEYPDVPFFEVVKSFIKDAMIPED